MRKLKRKGDYKMEYDKFAQTLLNLSLVTRARFLNRLKNIRFSFVRSFESWIYISGDGTFSVRFTSFNYDERMGIVQLLYRADTIAYLELKNIEEVDIV